MASILISEDDPDVRRIVTHTMIEAGHEVSAARDGEATLQLLLAGAPDILILDLMLPGIDGFQLLQEMAAARLAERVKVLVLTAKGSEQDWERAFELGAVRYVTKPFDPQELVGVVKELLELTRPELIAQREKQRDRARLLSQLESLFDGS